MSRSSQKRKDKRKEVKAKAFAEAQTVKASAPPDVPASATPTPPQWMEETVSADVSERDDVASLRTALFRLCLSVSAGDRFDEVAEDIAGLLEVDGVILSHLVDGQGEGNANVRLEPLGTFQEHASTRSTVEIRSDDGMLSRTLTHGEMVMVADARRDEVFVKTYGLGANIGSLLAVPLQYRGQVVGVLTMTRREVGGFHEIAMELARNVADQIALDLAQSQLFREAVSDPMTSVFGRQAMLFLLQREVEIATRHGEALTLMMVDVDGLCEFNQQHGMPAGDALLKSLSARLQEVVRGADVCVRFGGDEFAILMPRTDLDRARIAANRVRAAFASEPLEIDAELATPDSPLPTLTFGVAILIDADDGLSLLNRADHALAAAKAKGGGRLALADEEHTVIVLEPEELDSGVTAGTE